MLDSTSSQIMNIYEKRMQLLIQTVSSEDFEFLSKSKFFEDAKNNLDVILSHTGQKLQFFSDLFITTSRSWESYSKENIGQRRFIDYKSNKKLKYEIQSSTSFMSKLLGSDITLKQYENEKNKLKSKQILKSKLKILQFLLFTELTLQDIDDCFDNIQFIAYQSKILSCIRGFNNFQGTIIYINENFDHPETLEWSMIETLYLWKINNQNPFLIPIELSNYQRVDARPPSCDLGDLYFCAKTKRCPYDASPFKMNQVRREFL